MPRYLVCSYDVWGNEEDGFDVNAVYRTNTILEMSEEDFNNDETLVKALTEEYLEDWVTVEMFDIDSTQEDVVYFNDAKSGRPLFEVRNMDMV